MKRVYLILVLLILVPAFDSCIGCNCELSEVRYDYSNLEFYQISSLPVGMNEQFEVEVLAVVEAISQNKKDFYSGSALMACSCITNYYPMYEISEVEVTTTPSFFNLQDSISIINPIVEVIYFDEDYTEHTVSLGESTTPQFSITDGPFFTARILERPFAADSTYSINFKITKSNGETVSSTIDDVIWVK